MSTTTDHSQDNIIRLLQEALAITILLENDVQTQQSDSIEALSLGIIHSKLSETTKLLSEFFQKELQEIFLFFCEHGNINGISIALVKTEQIISGAVV